jgi:RNA polymerase sigma-70 factor (ECF subfamily)
MTDLAEVHDGLRPLMFSIAYRMLGSIAEAEDVVQEAFLRLHTSLAAGETVRSVDAYATTVTTRLAIDTLRSARVRREEYVGEWLPEPIVDRPDLDPAVRYELEESLSIAFLTLLERLSPVERAVFVLREVFQYEYAEVALVVDRSEVACRQLLRRARQRLGDAEPALSSPDTRSGELLAAFIGALEAGDVAAVERLLSDDVEFHADGGGRAPAVLHPIVGREQVARFVAALARQGARFGARFDLVVANGRPALAIRTDTGDLASVMGLDAHDGRIRSLSNQMNPDKLRGLGEVADLRALLAAGPPS